MALAVKHALECSRENRDPPTSPEEQPGSDTTREGGEDSLTVFASKEKPLATLCCYQSKGDWRSVKDVAGSSRLCPQAIKSWYCVFLAEPEPAAGRSCWLEGRGRAVYVKVKLPPSSFSSNLPA